MENEEEDYEKEIPDDIGNISTDEEDIPNENTIDNQNDVASKKHHNTTEKKPKNHKCDLCEKSFYVPAQLLSHIQCVHEGVKKYKCKFVNKNLVN